MHAFEHQDTAQTLRDGLAGYYRGNPALVRGERLSPQAAEFFRCHDAAHVVFGCGTTLPQEAVVKLSSLFGTTAGLSVLRGYRLHESVEIYKKLGVRDILATLAAAVLLVPKTIGRCLRQRKRWPWNEFADGMDVPLGQLRAGYGIKVPGARRPRA